VRIVIISDLHANIEALSSIPEKYDELWVLGDLVDYGPSPAEVIRFVRAHASAVVRGNHDHAVAHGVDPRCSPAFREMAEATMAFTREALTAKDHEYLSGLPPILERVVDGTRFILCHAAPTDPLFSYVPGESNRWETEADATAADVLLVGHTHIPFVRHTGGALVVNPGSLGQPKHGSPQACYAVWDRGIELHAFDYPVQSTAARIAQMPLSRQVREDLIAVLRSGGQPSGSGQH
jgi:protein phosphatase